MTDYATLVFQYWLRFWISYLEFWADHLDPRPDLALPARRQANAVGWWW